MTSHAGFRPKIAILWLARSFGLFALARRLSASRLRILCYHGGRLGDENGYNPKLFCSADVFSSRLDWLERTGFRIVGLDQAVATPSARRQPLETVITFDDGWYSTAATLLPLLAERRLPSTLYLCTQHYLEGWPVLAVTIRYILWKSARRSIRIDGFGADVDGEHDLGQPGARDKLARSLFANMAAAAQDRTAVCAALERLAACAGIEPAALDLYSRRFEYMTADELRAAAASGCAIELHGHVHDYPTGDPERFRADLARCDEVIREAGLPVPRHYCYPSGAFDGGAAAVLEERSVVSATTCVPGLVDGVDAPQRYYLPRFLDGENIHPLEFQAELSGFSEFLRKLLKRTPSNGYLP